MGHAGVGRLVAARDESMTGSRRGWLLFPGWTQAGFLKHATAAVARPFGLAGDFRSQGGANPRWIATTRASRAARSNGPDHRDCRAPHRPGWPTPNSRCYWLMTRVARLLDARGELRMSGVRAAHRG